MTARTPGRLIGRGRSADVYELGEGRVLRRYRVARTAELEASVMTHVRAHGFPAPEVFDAEGPDMVLQRLDGPTMLADLGRRPSTLFTHARLLAELGRRLHAIPPPPGLRRPFGEGEALLHLDLHPDNVILTADGPMLIDWPNVAVGPPEADTADAWVILATAPLDGAPLVSRLGRHVFLAAFLHAAGRKAAARILPTVADFRLGDRNMTPDEAVRIKRLAQRYRGR